MQKFRHLLAALACIVVALASFALSYVAIQDVSVAVEAVPASLAWLVPVVIDGGIICGSAIIWAASKEAGRRPVFPFLFVAALVVISVVVNVNHAGDSILAKVIAGLPPLILLGTLELVAAQGRRKVETSTETVPAETRPAMASASVAHEATFPHQRPALTEAPLPATTPVETPLPVSAPAEVVPAATVPTAPAVLPSPAPLAPVRTPAGPVAPELLPESPGVLSAESIAEIDSVEESLEDVVVAPARTSAKAVKATAPRTTKAASRATSAQDAAEKPAPARPARKTAAKATSPARKEVRVRALPADPSTEPVA